MISIDAITNIIEEKLNNSPVNSDIVFKLHKDTGKYAKALSEINKRTEYVNGLIEVTNSVITPNNAGILVGEMTVRVEVVFACADTDPRREIKTDGSIMQGAFVEGNVSRVEHIRNIIDNNSQLQYVEDNFPDSVKDDNDNPVSTYLVTGAFSLAATGQRMNRPIIGDSMSFIFYAYFNIVQNGENSRNDIYWLDGELIPYAKATTDRKNISEADVYNGDFLAKGTDNATTIQWSLVCPAFVTAFNAAVKKYLIDGEMNVAHVLKIQYGDEYGAAELTTQIRTYLVKFESVSRNSEGVLAVGKIIILSPIVDDYEMISFPETYTTYLAKDISGFNGKGKYRVKFNNRAIGIVANPLTTNSVQIFDTVGIYNNGSLSYFLSSEVELIDDYENILGGAGIIVSTTAPTSLLKIEVNNE